MEVDLGVLETQKVHDLLGAVQSRSHVFFDYKGRRRRQVEPLRIVNRRGQWYLQAREDGKAKIFRVDRLDGLYVSPREDMYDLDPLPERPSILNAEPWEFGETQPIDTTIRFEAEAAWYIRSRLPPSARISEEEDGSLSVVMGVSNPGAFFAWLLDFAPDGEIVSPVSVREEMVEWVRLSLEEVSS